MAERYAALMSMVLILVLPGFDLMGLLVLYVH